MSDTFQYIPRYVLTKEGKFLTWKDYNREQLRHDSVKKYILKFTNTCVYINDIIYAPRILKSKFCTVKKAYKNGDKSLIVYTNGWAKMETEKESTIGFIV